jgi:hypothetical protein
MVAIPEAYDDSLHSRAASVEMLLERVKTTSLFKSIVSHSLLLSQGDVSTLTNPEEIPWSLLREKILNSIATNKAETKGQVACRTKRHTQKCGHLQRKFSRSGVQVVVLNSAHKTLEWQSALHSLAIEFTKQVHLSLGRADDNHDMVTSLNEILANDIMPPSDVQLQGTLYYVASWLVFALKKHSTRRVGKLKTALEEIATNASTTREEAVSTSSLPTKRIVTREKYDGLTYATPEFFTFVVKLETLYESHLSDEKFKIWGPMLIEHINEGILKSDLSIKEFLPSMEEGDETNETIKNAFRLLILTYGHMRGKDFAKCKNSLAKGNLTVAHRSTIAAVSNGKLHGAKKENGADNNSATSATTTADGDGNDIEEDTSIISSEEDIAAMLDEAVDTANQEYDYEPEIDEEYDDDEN